jgi:hypothetical protein
MSPSDHSASKPTSFPGDRRLAARSRIHLSVSLITPAGEVHAATVTNVSALGFRIRAEYGVTLGRFLSLDVPGLARYSGWVAWSHAGEFGLDVANPIPQKVVDYITACSRVD